MNRAFIVLPLTLLVTLLTATGQTLLKRVVNDVPQGETVAALVGYALTDIRFWCGIAVTAIGTLTWLVVLARSDLSFATPFAAIGSILIVLVTSAVFLNEPIGALRLAGTLVAAVGVALVAWS